MAPYTMNFTLNNGTVMPSVGMGCWMGAPGGGQRVYDMCLKALKNGYRHFDTAAGYGNEQQVGQAIRDSGIPRSEIYLTTKLLNSDHHRVREAFEGSLRNLDCEYVDLYLIHWPQADRPVKTDGLPDILSPDEKPTIVDTWKDMEKLLESGKVKSIGVSNFSIKTLEILLPHCTVVPVTNQVELHPCLPQNELKEFCDTKGILLTAYSPLGRPESSSPVNLITEPQVKAIADKLGIETGQVLLSWAVQRGIAVVPKTENESRMIKNISLIELSKDDMQTLDGIHRQPGMHRSLLSYHNYTQDGTVFGWTYEQMGWNMTKGGIVVSS